MKNIKVTKKVWKRVKKLRNELGFKHYSKTIQWLFDRSFKGENLQKTKDENPSAENIKNLEVKMLLPDIRAHIDQIIQEIPEEKKEQPLLFKIQCVECRKEPFTAAEVISESGITCPHCGYVHSIALSRDSDGQILFQCKECNHHSFGVNEIRTDFWAIHCPHCRVLHKIRLILNEKKEMKK